MFACTCPTAWPPGPTDSFSLSVAHSMDGTKQKSCCLCTCGCACGWGCVCVGVVFCFHCVFYFRPGLSLSWNLLISLEWLASKPWGSVSTSPVLGLEECTTRPIFSRGSGAPTLCLLLSQWALEQWSCLQQWLSRTGESENRTPSKCVHRLQISEGFSYKSCTQ